VGPRLSGSEHREKGKPMTIPYVEERRKWLALSRQSEAVEAEQAQAIEPLERVAAAKWQEVLARHKAAGGNWPGSLEDHRKVETLAAAEHAPAVQAVKEAKRPFAARLDALQSEIEKIEAIAGPFSEDPWSGGGTAVCAMTGLPILESDKVGVVIAAALPVTAAINAEG
jgi:hypothetical protein